MLTVRTLRAYLANRDDDSPALFSSQGADWTTGKGITDVVKRLAERVEVRLYYHGGRGNVGDVTAHTLRHSIAYRLLHTYDGYTLYNVRNRLRHQRFATTEQRYDHFERV